MAREGRGRELASNPDRSRRAELTPNEVPQAEDTSSQLRRQVLIPVYGQLSARLKQLYRVPRWVFDDDLRSARSSHDVGGAECDASCA